jgi:hypothetical protein
VRRVSPSLLAFLLLALGIRVGGQIAGSCSPSPVRSPQDIQELQGAVVDENLAVIPKSKVKLQRPDGRNFRDIASVETDPMGRFSFTPQHPGRYRFVFAGPRGFCPAAIPINYSKSGFKGIRLTLPVGATDTCPQYCEGRLKIQEMSGR